MDGTGEIKILKRTLSEAAEGPSHPLPRNTHGPTVAEPHGSGLWTTEWLWLWTMTKAHGTDVTRIH